MIMPNVAYFPIVYYAILRIGAIAVPTNPLLKAGEIAYVWGDGGAQSGSGVPAVRRGSCQGSQRTGTEVMLTSPGEFDAELAEPNQPIGRCRAKWWRNRSDLVHLRDHRPAQGRRAEPRQPAAATSDHGRDLIPMAPGDVIFGGLPLFHSFGQTCA